MNFKKVLVLLLFAIAIIGIIAPAEAKLEIYSGVYEQYKDKTKISLQVESDIGLNAKNWDSPIHIPKRKAELNKVNKAVVKIKGYKDVTFKKPSKGWEFEKNAYSFVKIFSVKGNPEGKSYSIKLYDKKGKVIKNKKGKIYGGKP